MHALTSYRRVCPTRAPRVCTHAIKRVIEPAFFDDVYNGVYEKVHLNAQSLKLEETLILCESVRTPEHGLKALDCIARHLENRAGTDVNDWRHRKKYYMKLCIASIKMQRPDLVFAILGNQMRFQVATYFAREVIREIASMGTPGPILYRVAELTKLQRGSSDKGTKQAYQELIQALASRKLPGDADLLIKAKAELKALYSTNGIIISNGSPPPPPPPGRLFTPVELVPATALVTSD